MPASQPEVMKEGFYEDECSIMWIEDGIGFQVYKPNLVITLPAAQKMVEARVNSFKGVSHPVLVDIRQLLSVDSATRKYFASKEASTLITAGAIYLDNPLTRWAGNIFLKFDKPVTPAKLFTNRDKALIWLQHFKFMN